MIIGKDNLPPPEKSKQKAPADYSAGAPRKGNSYKIPKCEFSHAVKSLDLKFLEIS